MKIAYIATTALLTIIAVPAIAQMGDHMMGKPDQPTTRAEVETRTKAMFAMVDANNDGIIIKAEADTAHGQMETRMRDAHFNGMDANKDGSISRAEFDAAHMGPEKGMKHEGKEHDGHDKGVDGDNARMGGGGMFERADANKDGKVTLAEALAQPLARFDAADTNKDGTLSAQEGMAAHAKMRGMMHHK